MFGCSHVCFEISVKSIVVHLGSLRIDGYKFRDTTICSTAQILMFRAMRLELLGISCRIPSLISDIEYLVEFPYFTKKNSGYCEIVSNGEFSRINVLFRIVMLSSRAFCNLNMKDIVKTILCFVT